jgi:outer membrane protein
LKREKTIKTLARAVLVIGLLGSFCLAAGQDAVQPGETLNLDRCLQIALEHLPSLQAARATSAASRSLVREAEAAYYPQIDWTSSVSRSEVGPRTSLGVSTPSTTLNSYSTSLGLRQTIFDFGRTPAQVRVQRQNSNASNSDLETATQQAVFDVRQSYFAALQAKRNRDVAAEAVRQYQAHLDQARGLYEVGLQPRYDVTKATVDLGNAKVNLIKAENAVKLALATLNNIMGVTGTLDYGLEDNLSFDPYPITLEDALVQAYNNRPELAAFAARRQAAESSITLSKAGFFPVLGGTAAFDYGGDTFPLARGWSVGLSLSVPIFSGFSTPAQVAFARANLVAVTAQEEAQRQAVRLAVEQAFLDLKQAEAVVPVAELNVAAAKENFEIADGSYKEGVGDPIQVADASITLISAKLAYNQALYDCKVARASLELAMGVR